MSTSTPLRDLFFERAHAGGLSFDEHQIEALLEYWRLLTHWNRTINLTAMPLQPPTAEAVDKMLIEPLAAATELPEGSIAWADLGSGGGSPAIPMKIVRPQARLTMVESRGRKAAFLREASRALGLAEVVVEGGRIEEWVKLPSCGAFDCVTVRALAVDQEMAMAIAAHMTPDARLLYFGGAERPAIGPFEVCGDRALPPTAATLYILRPLLSEGS